MVVTLENRILLTYPRMVLFHQDLYLRDLHQCLRVRVDHFPQTCFIESIHE